MYRVQQTPILSTTDNTVENKKFRNGDYNLNYPKYHSFRQNAHERLSTVKKLDTDNIDQTNLERGTTVHNTSDNLFIRCFY